MNTLKSQRIRYPFQHLHFGQSYGYGKVLYLYTTFLFIFILTLKSCLPAESRIAGEEAKNKQAKSPYLLTWNGSPAPEGVPLILVPGKIHTLTIEAKTGFSFKADLLKTLPDGSPVSVIPAPAKAGKVTFEVGPFTAPTEYLYASGKVYRRGYQLQLTLTPGSGQVTQYHWCQPLASDKNEQLILSTEKDFVFTPGWGAKRLTQVERSLVMRPVISIRLHEKILMEPGQLEVLMSSRLQDQLIAQVKVTHKKGRPVYEQEVTFKGDHSLAIDPGGWEEGTYTLALHPYIDGNYWEEGPVLKYHHTPQEKNEVIVSPLTHWSLQIDEARTTLTLNNMGDAVDQYAKGKYDKSCWRVDGSGRLLSKGSRVNQTPISLDLGLKGHYALFVEPVEEALVQVGDAGLIRPVSTPLVEDKRGTYVVAKDFTNVTVNLFPPSQDGYGIKAIHLIPVTGTSVKKLYQQVGSPEIPVVGVNDWKVYFKPQSRVEEDQIENIIAAQKEIGLHNLAWSVGRSVIEYKSQLEEVTLFPAPPPLRASESENKIIWDRWNKLVNIDYYTKAEIIKKIDAYETALAHASKHQVGLSAWLAMNRHYHGDVERDLRWSLNSSLFYRENPQWHQVYKDGSPIQGNGRMSYYFPGVRKERVDILLEVASKGPGGLLIGGCRQVPMLAYNPEMVKEYKKLTGVDPTKIDATDSLRYTQWIQWRANFFTELLRELKVGLRPIENDLRKEIPVTVRIPSAGIYWNLAQGLDVTTWMEEKLVDKLQLDPLEDRDGRGSHDVSPYVRLGQKHDVEIYGGVGSSWFLNDRNGLVPGLMRLHGLQTSGVDGIEIYETELTAVAIQARWLIPYAGKPGALESFLKNSNLLSCFPISSTTAAYGHDNHSFREAYDIVGFGHESL